MPHALTADAFLAALRAEGVRLCENCVNSDWRGHRRGSFAHDVVGVVVHHTASNQTPTSLIRDGRPDLSGPLSLAHMTRDDALIHLVGYGRCNHAGMLDGDVIAAMRDGRPAPAPDRDSVNANPITYSIEVNGTDDDQPFTPEMVDNLVRFNTAICRAHNWNEYHVIGHREGTRRKPTDPAGIGMPTLRALVANRLRPAVPIIWPDLTLEDKLMFPILRRGTDGVHVRILQGLLRGNGHQVAVDGDFGPATEKALRRHQQAWAPKLTVTGVADQNDWRSLLRQPLLPSATRI